MKKLTAILLLSLVSSISFASEFECFSNYGARKATLETKDNGQMVLLYSDVGGDVIAEKNPDGSFKNYQREAPDSGSLYNEIDYQFDSGHVVNHFTSRRGRSVETWVHLTPGTHKEVEEVELRHTAYEVDFKLETCKLITK
jgi:hypothetical protein